MCQAHYAPCVLALLGPRPSQGLSGIEVRAPTDTIAAPLFPTKLPWVNVPGGQWGRASTIQRGRPMLVEFWDFCRPHSLRTLPYLKAWHERYAEHGLRVIGVHSPGFEPSRDPDAVRAAVMRLGIEYPVLIDSELELWQEYENAGWPARYLFDGRARLFEYHYGEGAYAETECAIQELVGVEREPLPPVRPEDAPGALLAAQTEDQPGAYSGPYEAGGVWAVLDVEEAGTVRVNGAEHEVAYPSAYPLIEHDRHTAGVIELEVGPGVTCYATCFTPGLAT
jgi:thiol-disulfide isomerase/thioredoxin